MNWSSPAQVVDIRSIFMMQVQCCAECETDASLPELAKCIVTMIR